MRGLPKWEAPGFCGGGDTPPPPLFVILLPRPNPLGAVELLQQDHAHQAVGKGEVGEGQARVGPGQQLIGQAVCTYRALGRERLRLRCAPDNLLAQRFYKRYGFVRIGPAPGARVPLDLLEKSI